METKDPGFNFIDSDIKDKAENLLKTGLEGLSENLSKTMEIFQKLIPKISESKLTGPEIFRQLIDLNLESTKILNDYTKQAVDKIFLLVQNSDDLNFSNAKKTTGPSTQRNSELNVTGEIGKNLLFSFTVNNSGNEILDASISSSDLINEDGNKILSKYLKITPAKISLKPDTEAQIQIKSVIDRKFTPDKIYQSEINIKGQQSRIIVLKIHTIKSAESSDKDNSVPVKKSGVRKRKLAKK